MKYYSIGKSTDLDTIGEYPQIEKEYDYNLADPHSYWNVSWNKLPDFNPVYKIKIQHKAKITNLLNNLSGFYGLTVDRSLKELLSKFKLPEHKFYPIQVAQNNKQLDYYWFHFVNSFLEYVDFQNTTFELFRATPPFNVLKELSFSSVSELHKMEDKLNFEKDICLKKIILKKNFPNYDIISLSNIAPILLVSENLKKALEESDLNGFVFGEYEPLIV
jgi:hypothetical protein